MQIVNIILCKFGFLFNLCFYPFIMHVFLLINFSMRLNNKSSDGENEIMPYQIKLWSDSTKWNEMKWNESRLTATDKFFGLIIDRLYQLKIHQMQINWIWFEWIEWDRLMQSNTSYKGYSIEINTNKQTMGFIEIFLSFSLWAESHFILNWILTNQNGTL